ncbi:uncharacterized protein LOC144129786 [Amblyomma americanum]
MQPIEPGQSPTVGMCHPSKGQQPQQQPIEERGVPTRDDKKASGGESAAGGRGALFWPEDGKPRLLLGNTPQELLDIPPTPPRPPPVIEGLQGPYPHKPSLQLRQAPKVGEQLTEKKESKQVQFNESISMTPDAQSDFTFFVTLMAVLLALILGAVAFAYMESDNRQSTARKYDNWALCVACCI